MNLLTRVECLLLPFFLMSTITLGCVSFEPVMPSQVEHFDERPLTAILPFTFDLPITSLATLKTIEQAPLPRGRNDAGTGDIAGDSANCPLAPREQTRHRGRILLCTDRSGGRIDGRVAYERR